MLCWILTLTLVAITLCQPPPQLSLQGRQLHIRYGDRWILPGAILNIQDTRTLPEISRFGLRCSSRYLLLFLDLDVVTPSTATQTVILHWYRPDLVANCSEPDRSTPLVPDEDRTSPYVAPYIGPRPPPGSHHRYVYLLFAQPAAYRFPKCFSHIPPETVEARAGFDVRAFMQAAALDPPVAVNYFFARNDAPDRNGPTSPAQTATTTSFRSMTCDTSPTCLRW